mmetsp:Transcript_42429/g.99572  ORF Transcript_42429/g.99572 Transcript_42429/m.99572 type:complete len:200 (-) Transcript_42429:877-1476(-)
MRIGAGECGSHLVRAVLRLDPCLRKLADSQAPLTWPAHDTHCRRSGVQTAASRDQLLHIHLVQDFVPNLIILHFFQEFSHNLFLLSLQGPNCTWKTPLGARHQQKQLVRNDRHGTHNRDQLKDPQNLCTHSKGSVSSRARCQALDVLQPRLSSEAHSCSESANEDKGDCIESLKHGVGVVGVGLVTPALDCDHQVENGG